MTGFETEEAKRRNRNFDDTHRILISKAVEMVTQRGKDAVSVAALARATGINRTTIYYHFDNRDDLMVAVHEAIAAQPKPQLDVSQWMGVDDISSAIQRDPEMVKAWVDHYTAAGDFVEQYPKWGGLVAQLAKAFAELANDGAGDAEVFCEFLLASAIDASHKFTPYVNPNQVFQRILSKDCAKTALLSHREGSRPYSQDGSSRLNRSVSSS